MPLVGENGLKEVQGDKENVTPAVEHTPTNTMNPPPQPSSQRSAGKDIRDCPQTPVGRLPLSELLSNGEEHHYYQDLTPTERVLWDNSPLSSATPNLTRKAKKRKRAHSSSPTSSSQNRSSRQSSERKFPNDVSALHEALKTPKANLVDDLWSRYSLNTTGEGPSIVPFNVDFPKLMHSSSPAPDLPNRDNTRLRRAFSCVDWPTSAAKRRRLEISNSQAGDVAELAKFDKPVESVEKAKSRVSLLLERIHDYLAKPSHLQEFSSSDPGSSPAALKQHSLAKKAPVSAYNLEQVDSVTTTLSQACMGESRSNLQPSVLPTEGIAEWDQAEGSSDFGDDDLDMEMIEALSCAAREEKVQTDGRLRQTQMSGHIPQATTPNSIEGLTMGEQNKPAQLTDVKRSTEVTALKPGSATHIQKRDEFDGDNDDDDDNIVTAAELESVSAKDDKQFLPPPPLIRTQIWKGSDLLEKERSTSDSHSRSNSKTVMPIEVSSDDEDDFGGDSDFEQIAAEVAASQDEKGRSQASAPVCNKHYRSSALLR